jgi:hypothetical protein
MYKITDFGFKQAHISLARDKKENIIEMLEELTEWFNIPLSQLSVELDISLDYLQKIIHEEAVISKEVGKNIYTLWRLNYSKKLVN